MLGSLLVWYEGGRGVLDDSIALGTLSAFMMYVGMFYGPVRWMSMLLNWASRSLTAAERVFEVLDSEPDVKETDNATPMPHIEGRVTFEDVTFGYDPHSPVLKHINFEAKPGEMIGFVGHSGAGKTTCINLLCRFYDADEGRILVNGVPLRELRVADLRHQIGVVPQDTFLFSGSIADNIAYAKPGASKEEIIRAAKIANAHDFIVRKPDGYESWVGEGGQGLSAGERQRLAIARAVLHDPRILVLDEATSSARCGDRETNPGGDPAPHRRTDDLRHRTPSLDPEERGPPDRPEGRGDHGNRHPRRTPGEGGRGVPQARGHVPGSLEGPHRRRLAVPQKEPLPCDFTCTVTRSGTRRASRCRRCRSRRLECRPGEAGVTGPALPTRRQRAANIDRERPGSQGRGRANRDGGRRAVA